MAAEEKQLSQSPPVFNAPRIVIVSLAVLVLAHVVRTSLLSQDADEWLIGAAAFIPARYDDLDLPGGMLAKLASPLTYALLHGDYTHLVFNCGWLLAFGTIVARRVSAAGFLALAGASAIGGALLFLVMNLGLRQPMIGASGAISGLMGAAVRFIFLPDAGSMPGSGYAPSMTLTEVLGDRRCRMLIGSWLLFNLLFGLFLGQLFTDSPIAWEAHVGGFMTGLLLFPLFERPPAATEPGWRM